MSKKLYSTQKWKDYIRTRQEAEQRNARRRRTGPKFTGTLAQKQQARSRRHFQTVEAPSVLSIVRNPDGAMRFFINLELYSSRYNINLDLSKVDTLTTDAIAALLATIRRLDVGMRGNLPGNADAQRMLLESGFFDYVSSTQQLPRVKRGSIEQQKSKMVEPLVAAELVHFGTKGIFGSSQKCTAAYGTLIECMANTRNHASGRSDKSWKRPERRNPRKRGGRLFTRMLEGVKFASHSLTRASEYSGASGSAWCAKFTAYLAGKTMRTFFVTCYKGRSRRVRAYLSGGKASLI